MDIQVGLYIDAEKLLDRCYVILNRMAFSGYYMQQWPPYNLSDEELYIYLLYTKIAFLN